MPAPVGRQIVIDEFIFFQLLLARMAVQARLVIVLPFDFDGRGVVVGGTAAIGTWRAKVALNDGGRERESCRVSEESPRSSGVDQVRDSDVTTTTAAAASNRIRAPSPKGS